MATTVRAAVMLSVLVGLPAAWIYYGPLPAGPQGVVNRALTAVKAAVGWNKDKTAEDQWVRVDAARSAPKTGTQNPAPAAEVSLAPPALMTPVTAATKPPTLAERVEPSLTKLRQLGAIEYALEHWGADGKLYRFRCEMSVGASQLTQQFEAVSADPQMSIEQVLAEVTARQITAQPTEIRPAGFAM